MICSYIALLRSFYKYILSSESETWMETTMTSTLEYRSLLILRSDHLIGFKETILLSSPWLREIWLNLCKQDEMSIFSCYLILQNSEILEYFPHWNIVSYLHKFTKNLFSLQTGQSFLMVKVLSKRIIPSWGSPLPLTLSNLIVTGATFLLRCVLFSIFLIFFLFYFASVNSKTVKSEMLPI